MEIESSDTTTIGSSPPPTVSPSPMSSSPPPSHVIVSPCAACKILRRRPSECPGTPRVSKSRRSEQHGLRSQRPAQGPGLRLRRSNLPAPEASRRAPGAASQGASRARQHAMPAGQPRGLHLYGNGGAVSSDIAAAAAAAGAIFLRRFRRRRQSPEFPELSGHLRRRAQSELDVGIALDITESPSVYSPNSKLANCRKEKET
ncbi:hypothetical protein U1Q18_020954 [Sarracenia purpurea var. burkii]